MLAKLELGLLVGGGLIKTKSSAYKLSSMLNIDKSIFVDIPSTSNNSATERGFLVVMSLAVAIGIPNVLTKSETVAVVKLNSLAILVIIYSKKVETNNLFCCERVTCLNCQKYSPEIYQRSCDWAR